MFSLPRPTGGGKRLYKNIIHFIIVYKRSMISLSAGTCMNSAHFTGFGIIQREKKRIRFWIDL